MNRSAPIQTFRGCVFTVAELGNRRFFVTDIR